MKNSLIILDRDGILNKLLNIDGITDSPMTLSQIEIFPWVPSVLKQLNDLGYGLVIATNQPAWAKNKISFEHLNEIHNNIVEQIQCDGAKILSSHICFHRAEDLCLCRKPKTGLLQDAFNINSEFSITGSWMVGDRATDIIAGTFFKLRTAWLGKPINDDETLLLNNNLTPSYKGQDLRDFLNFISLNN